MEIKMNFVYYIQLKAEKKKLSLKVGLLHRVERRWSGELS